MAGPFALASAVQAKLLALLPKPLNTPTDGQVLTADSSSTAGVSWKASTGGGNGGTVVDADANTKGVLRLAGDLSGTADAPALKAVRASAISVGDSDSIPVLTIDAAGRVTAASQVDLNVLPSAVVGLLEYIQDTVAGMVVAGSGMTVYYNDAAGSLTLASTGGGGGSSSGVSVHRQNADGSYASPVPVDWYIGTTVPDSSDPTVADGSIFSMLDGSS